MTSGLPPPQLSSDEDDCKQPSHQLQKFLNKNGKRERNRIRAIQELIATEETYVKNMNTLINIYATPIKLKKFLKTKEYEILFPSIIQSILHLNSNLLKSIKSTSETQKTLGETMLDFIPYLKMYQTYINNHQKAIQLLIDCKSDTISKMHFNQYLQKYAMSHQPLESYLILPIQRILRYELCLKEIIRLTLDTNADKHHLEKCLSSVIKINCMINKQMLDFDQEQKLISFEKRFLLTSNSISIVGRKLIKKAYLNKVSRKKDIRYLFVLFNDSMLYCSEILNDGNANENENSFLKLHQILPFDEYFEVKRIFVLEDGKSLKYGRNCNKCFEIHTTLKSFLCYCSTFEEREEWVIAIVKCLNEWKSIHLKQRRMSNAHEYDGRILATAPIWIPNDFTNECMIDSCAKKLSYLLINRRNHCQYCGKLVCNDCCTKELPHYLNYVSENQKKLGINSMKSMADMVKVCDECYEKYGEIPHLMGIGHLEQIRKSLVVREDMHVIIEENENIIKIIDDSTDDEYEVVVDGEMVGDGRQLKSNEGLLDFMHAFSVSNLLAVENDENVDCKKSELDENHGNVQVLMSFGFTMKDIENAYALMKENGKTCEIVADHGPLFIETMLDYLSRVSKNKSKISILSQYKNV